MATRRCSRGSSSCAACPDVDFARQRLNRAQPADDVYLLDAHAELTLDAGQKLDGAERIDVATVEEVGANIDVSRRNVIARNARDVGAQPVDSMVGDRCCLRCC